MAVMTRQTRGADGTPSHARGTVGVITQSDAVGAPDRAETLHATFAVEGLALAPTAGNTNRKGR